MGQTPADAATRTNRGDDARRARGSSTTTGIRSATAVTTRSPTSPLRANATTVTWPRSTTAGKPWLGIAARGPVPWGRRRLRRRDDRRSGTVGPHRRAFPGHDRERRSDQSFSGASSHRATGNRRPARVPRDSASASSGARTPTRPNVLGVTLQAQQARRCRKPTGLQEGGSRGIRRPAGDETRQDESEAGGHRGCSRSPGHHQRRE